MTTKRRKTPPKIGDLASVTWLDAWCDSDEKVAEDFADDCIVVTHGTIVRLTKDVISLSPEAVRDKWHRGTTHIPRAIVTSIEVVKRG